MMPRTFANHLSPLERKYAKAARATAEQRRLVEEFVAVVKAADGRPRDLGPNVVDLIAIRAQRS